MGDYRLYVDETGDHTRCVDGTAILGARFLGLVGVMIERGEKYDAFAKALEDFKRAHLPYDADEPPPILHRQDIINRNGPFHRLQDETKRAAFDAGILELTKATPFVLITIVLDKLTHGRAQYRALQHPYHYCLLAMLERYCGRLDRFNSKGDVLVESRGGNEDRAFEEAYVGLYEHGSGSRGYLSPARTKATLTSKRPKLKKKAANIAGLQLADFIAHTATRDVLIAEGRLTAWTSPFAGELAKAIPGKYNRHLWNDRIRGYGRVLLD